MSRLRMAAGAACCFVALISGQAYASGEAQCWQPYEVEAAKVRDLHIMLMLGALKCKARDQAITDKYEAFLTKQSDLLSSYNNVLKTHFLRVNGINDGLANYEAFNTRLGNSHSGANQAASYCQTTDTLLTLATEARDRELPRLAQNFSESALGIEEVCAAATTPVTVDAMPGTAPATTVAAAAPVTDAVASAPADTAPVTVAKTDAAAPTPQSAAAALEAAAAALQTAAASLKAQPAEAATGAKVEKATHETLPSAQPAVIQPASATTAEPVG